MFDALLWLYAVNFTLLVLHEIDSAFWQEWRLFHIPGGSGFFVWLHAPLVMFFLWGFIEIFKQSTRGLVVSLILSFAGILAFVIHGFFLARGRPEFKKFYSVLLLAAMLALSLAQIMITTSLLI